MMTTISSLLKAGLFRKYNFVCMTARTFNTNNQSSQDFQTEVYHLYIQIDGDIRKFIQIPVS